ncbi:MAG: hypothetical protein Q8O56_04680 [Solirubrobacteraceae bacterium]|nr:hypothetical protein [Solirubrobacteraceae bacterium]
MTTGDADRLNHSAQWQATGSVDAIQDQLLAVVRRRGGRVDDSRSGSLQAHLGSRLASRLGGMATKGGRARLPLRLRADLTQPAPDEVYVAVTIEDDEGWNLFNAPWRDERYRAAMTDLADELAATTSATAGRADGP